MNAVAWIILITLAFEYLLGMISDALNIGTLSRPLPEEFHGLFDATAYAKSQEYTKARTVFGVWSATWNIALLSGFWFAGGFEFLDTFVRGWGAGALLSGIAYIGILLFCRSLLALPWSVYSTFVIEERFGFNKTTVATYVSDLLKGAGLAVALGGPLLILVLWLFAHAGTWAWLYCWAAIVLFTLTVQFIAPAWIMPLFNKFTPLEEGELRNRIVSFAESVKFSLQNVFVIDGSKRSGKSNAFFTGFGKNKRIALFDTLIRQHTVDELVAVLAHEIGHYKKRHILQGMVVSIVHSGMLLYFFSLLLNRRELYDAFFVSRQSLYTGLIFCGMLISPVEFIISLLLNILSRKNEFSADKFAAETTGHPGIMADALKKLSLNNLSHLTPHPLYVFLNYSHPPVLERIRALNG
jgi:STE24 endopeptidase